MARFLFILLCLPILYVVKACMVPEDVPAAVPVVATYVGDGACSSCHGDIAISYAQTNHKRGFARFESAEAIETFEGETTVYHEPRNLYYDVFTRGDTLFQREYRLDVNDNVIHELIEPADFVIGSGNATRSYLMERNGFVTEMPITWYVEREYWEMSPGYEEANDRFGRKIILDCMTCHTGIPTHSPFTQNHFTEVPLGISCERCHGPGGEHVAYWQNQPEGAGLDDQDYDQTIVNPVHLDRGRQMSNCQQCHLAGIFVFKEGEDATTFRPGQELAENRTVYVPEEHLEDPDWVGIDSHPLRLARSACYQETEMTCSTCHDPHKPASLLPENHYNDTCLSCHGGGHEEGGGTHSCSRPEVTTLAESTAGDCVSCHMQKGGTSDVPHVSFSDHWIRKDPGPPRSPDDAQTAFETMETIGLVALQQAGRSGHVLDRRTTNTASDQLEEAIAYFLFYEQMHRLPEYLPQIIDGAKAGLAGGSDHVEGRIALARSLVTTGEVDQALEVLEAAAAAYPGDAWVPFWQGTIQLENGNIEASIVALQQAVALQPFFMEAQNKLGEAFVRSRRLSEAQATLEAIVRYDPAHQPRAWFNLGLVYLQQQLIDAAEEAFRQASRLDPDLVEAHIQLGTVLLQKDQLDEAEQVLLKAIAADARSAPAYGSMALVYLKRGDVAGARQLLQGVLQIDPNNQAARSLLQQIR